MLNNFTKVSSVVLYNTIRAVILIGDISVGKTSLLQRYQKEDAKPRDLGPTIGVEFATKEVSVQDGQIVKAQIWDTAGQEKYRAICMAQYRKALGCLLVFDLTDRATFSNCKYWAESLIDKAQMIMSIKLVGNKLDLVQENPMLRKVSIQEAKDLCREYNNMSYVETSAMNAINVKSAFESSI